MKSTKKEFLLQAYKTISKNAKDHQKSQLPAKKKQRSISLIMYRPLYFINYVPDPVQVSNNSPGQQLPSQEETVRQYKQPLYQSQITLYYLFSNHRLPSNHQIHWREQILFCSGYQTVRRQRQAIRRLLRALGC